jgi:uncharacterized protein
MAKCGPIRSHSTETSERPWSGSRTEKKLGDADESTLRKAYAWVDCDSDPSTKSAYKFIHHEVDGRSAVGAANVRAATNGIAVLNGGRGGADVPSDDRRGIYNHLARHLRDAGKEPASLK